MVPDTLQIGRLPARLRTTYQQIASELEIKRSQLGIAYRSEFADPHVGRLVGLRRTPQVERNAPKITLVNCFVVPKRLPVTAPCIGQMAPGLLRGIARHVFIISEIGPYRNIDDCFVGMAYLQSAVGQYFQLTAHGLDTRHGGKPHLALNALVVIGPALQPKFVSNGMPHDIRLVRRRIPGRKRNAVLFGSRQPDNQQLVRKRSKGFPAISHTARRETGDRHCPPEVQLPFVIGKLRSGLEIQAQRTYRLIRHAVGTLRRTDGRTAKFLRFAVAALENQPPDFGQGILGRRIGIVVRRAAPHRFFVQLETLVFGTAEDHGPDPTVAQRKGFFPHFRRTVVAKFQILAFGPASGQYQQSKNPIFHLAGFFVLYKNNMNCMQHQINLAFRSAYSYLYRR